MIHKKKSYLGKIDLIKQLRKRHPNSLDEEDAQVVLELILDVIMTAIDQGKRVEIRKFGVFKPKVYKSRFGTNQAMKTRAFFPSRKLAAFSPSNYVINHMNN